MAMAGDQTETDIVVLDGTIATEEKYPLAELTKENGWVECPIPTMLGIPLMAKQISPCPAITVGLFGVFPRIQLAVYMMVEFVEGSAPVIWRLGRDSNLGIIGFGRRDGKPFKREQWSDLHSFVFVLMDYYANGWSSQDIIGRKIVLDFYQKGYLDVISYCLLPMAREQPTFICARCGLEASKRCSNCHFMYYCSRKCQLAHWREEHKSVCCDSSLRTPLPKEMEGFLNQAKLT